MESVVLAVVLSLEVDVAVDAFDFAGGELPSAGEPFVAVQQ